LIDLTMIPEEIKEKVLESYNTQKPKGKEKLMNYFIVNRLKNLMENIAEF